ncbi:hypothetical protein ACQPZP_33385 [Spirillospora sp. CA-142024]
MVLVTAVAHSMGHVPSVWVVLALRAAMVAGFVHHRAVGAMVVRLG